MCQLTGIDKNFAIETYEKTQKETFIIITINLQQRF